MTTPALGIDILRTDDPLLYPTRRAIEPSALDQVFRGARTAYAFTDEPVTSAQLDLLHDLMRFPPTAMNTQPLRVLLVTTPEAKARLAPHLAEGNRAKAASAPITAILAADTDFHDHLDRLVPHLPGARDRFLDDAARERTARFNATLQAGYLVLAVRAVGLDAGPMGGFDASGVDAEFLAGTALKSFLLVNIGHAAPDTSFPRAPRLERDEVFTIL